MFSSCDSHCHLESMKGYFPSSHPNFLHITCGYSSASNAANFEIAKKNENVFCCLGIAPQEAMKFADAQGETERAVQEIMQLHAMLPKKIVAIGEIGLDYHWAKTEEEKEKQMHCFLSMLSLSKKLSLPAVIHSRDCMDKVIEVLGKEKPKKIMMHCYSGTQEQTKKLISLGALFSLPPMRSKERKKVIKLSGINNIACETDAPYIGQSPQDVQLGVQMAADALGMQPGLVQAQCVRNAMDFFNIEGG